MRVFGTHRSKTGVACALFALVSVACSAAGTTDPGLDLDTGTPGGDSGDDAPFDVATPDGPDPTLGTLTIDPANTTIFIDLAKPSTPATLTYKATLNTDTGPKDVSASASFTLADPALGTFAGPVFTSALTLPGTALGATTDVTATAEGKSGAAKLTIVKIRKTEDSTGKRDFFFTVPYMKDPDPTRDVLKFSTNIQKVDVAFVMDTTGSMGGSITNLKTSLTTVIVPGLAKIPSVGMAVVDHRDFGDAWVANVRQIITTDVTKVNAGVAAMAAGGGGDWAEAQLAALHHTVTGAANGTAIKLHTPAAGTFGGVDFRPGAVPVAVLITDAPWHDPSGIATMANVQTAFKAKNVKFVAIDVTTASDAQANTLSDATGSAIPPGAFGGKCGAGKCCTGASGAGVAPTGPGGTCRLVFAAPGGAGVSDSVVTAITAISVGSTYDIKAALSNDPTNANGADGKPVDATKFIKALRAMDEGDAASACPAHEAYDSNSDGIKDTFKAVTVGTPICFEVIPKMNDFVPPLDKAQFFNAFIDMVGEPGDVTLGDRRTVVFLVPPKDAGIK